MEGLWLLCNGVIGMTLTCYQGERQDHWDDMLQNGSADALGHPVTLEFMCEGE